MYRYQRYFYDFTRKYYLLGRDQLINEMKIFGGDDVLEIGCGTGRNLAILGEKYPNSNFYGIDASAAMLETAEKKVESKNLKNVSIKNEIAGNFSFADTFGLHEPFDTVFFSYSISMIPDWESSIRNALANLKKGKSLYIVDFFDQGDMPKLFRRMIQTWLRQFDVIYPKRLVPFLKELEDENAGTLSLRSIFRSYAFIVEFKKTGGNDEAP